MMTTRAMLRNVLLVMVGLGACAQRPDAGRAHPSVGTPATPRAPATTTTAPPPPAKSDSPSAARGLVIVTDATVLASLESRAFDLGHHAFGAAATSAAELYQLPAYRSAADVIAKDIAAVAQSDGRAGVGMQHAHRLFNPAWLASPHMRFELIAVVNRIDRHAFDDQPGRCGELRLVYRLAYRFTGASTPPVDSRLPMTVNVVHWQRGTCADVAQRWHVPPSTSGPQLANWLVRPSGPLALAQRGALKSVEVNMQSVRWPSAVHPTMAGHAEYLMRVFADDGGVLVPQPMENQPDVDRIRQSPALKQRLLRWVKDNLDDIDAGVAQLPNDLLAKQARSVAPRGLARLANRPFSQLLRAADLTSLSLSAREHIRTEEELLRRLDTMSCVGCHHSRSLAGFHLLGEERQRDKRVDALAAALSPHLQQEAAFRLEVLATLREGSTDTRRRNPAERTAGESGWGEHCGLGPTRVGDASHFESWKCGAGLECADVLGEALIGMCVSSSRVEVGDACEPGTVTQHRDPHQDRVGAIERRTCEQGLCERNKVGFPGGMCAARCGDGQAEATCGAIALLTNFNDCLAKGQAFEGCIVNNSRRAGLRRCSQSLPCRDDYVCAKTASGDAACMPPYFLFQLRVDGHPL